MKYTTKIKIIKALAIIFLYLITGLIALMLATGRAMAEEAELLPDLTEPFTWEYLTTVGGCAIFVLLFVQATKKILDKLIVIPTTLYAYIIAVITMLAATAFSGGLTLSNGLLTLFNGWLVSATASKSFDVISGKQREG